MEEMRVQSLHWEDPLEKKMYKLDLEKAEEPEIKLPTSIGSQKKLENSRKTSTSVSLTKLKPLTMQITITIPEAYFQQFL